MARARHVSHLPRRLRNLGVVHEDRADPASAGADIKPPMT